MLRNTRHICVSGALRKTVTARGRCLYDDSNGEYTLGGEEEEAVEFKALVCGRWSMFAGILADADADAMARADVRTALKSNMTVPDKQGRLSHVDAFLQENAPQ